MTDAYPDKWGFWTGLAVSRRRRDRATLGTMPTEDIERLQRILAALLHEMHKANVAGVMAEAYHWVDGLKLEEAAKEHLLSALEEALPSLQPRDHELALRAVFDQLMDEAFPTRVDRKAKRRIGRLV